MVLFTFYCSADLFIQFGFFFFEIFIPEMDNINDTNNNSNENSPNDGLKKRAIIKTNDEIVDSVENDAVPFKAKIRWPDLMAQLFLHIGAVYGLIFQFYTIRFYTLIWCKYVFLVLVVAIRMKCS